MNSLNFGYLDNPANGFGIIRARTLIGNLRVWDLPRSVQAIDVVCHEIGDGAIPILYMLFDERNRIVYIGQSENLKSRLLSHILYPEEKIKNWDRVIFINDGRNASQSDLNDENIRLTLEEYLVRLFKINRYKVTTSSTRKPSLSAVQKIIVDTYKEEINILLTRKSKIHKMLTEKGDDEVYNDEVKKILTQKKFNISKWGKSEAFINNELAFVRPGSLKPIGWQVTFRGSKPESFKSMLEKGEGLLLMPRGKILLIPLSKIKLHILERDKMAFARDTIDIFIRFEEDRIVLVYKGQELEVTQYRILN